MKEIKDELLREDFGDDGFLYLVRGMKFNPVAGYRLIKNLERIDPPSYTADERKSLIAIVWRLPYYVAGYRDRCVENGASLEEYNKVLRDLRSVVERKMDALLE